MQYLSGPPFEPLARASFLDKTRKALFLLAMATAKRVSELQALSFSVSFQGEDLVLYYDPFSRAKTESAANPLPRSVIVPSLSDFAGDLPGGTARASMFDLGTSPCSQFALLAGGGGFLSFCLLSLRRKFELSLLLPLLGAP